MNTEQLQQLRAEFEAWAKADGYEDFERFGEGYAHPELREAWRGYLAGRAALQSQSMPPEISRDLLGKIVDEVFDGAIEDASVIEDIYRVVARECALQSQDREDAKRWRALKERSIATFMDNYGRTVMIATVEVDRFPNQITMEGLIDHARLAEGDGE